MVLTITNKRMKTSWGFWRPGKFLCHWAWSWSLPCLWRLGSSGKSQPILVLYYFMSCWILPVMLLNDVFYGWYENSHRTHRLHNLKAQLRFFCFQSIESVVALEDLGHTGTGSILGMHLNLSKSYRSESQIQVHIFWTQ